MSLNFEELFHLLSTNSYGSSMKGNPPLDYVLKGTFEINNIQKNSIFLNLIKKIVNEYNIFDTKLDASLFTSFLQGNAGNPHSDKYDVILYNLHGEVMYIVNKEKFLLKQGDLLYIKKENIHQSISITPRIVFSLGVRNDIG